MLCVENSNHDAIDADPEFDMRSHVPDQPSLFPTSELIIPAALTSLRKSVSAIHAVPLKQEHNHTLNTRRLFDACILIAQLDFRKRDPSELARVTSERIAPMFETRITELVKLAGIPGKNYERVKEDMEQLYEMDLRWNVVGEDSTILWDMKSHFLSSRGFGKGANRGMVRFSLDPDILKLVLEPSQWATLSLQVMHSLKTPSSLSLYQNCWKYVNTHAKVTAALPTETWIQLLVGQSRYVKTDAKGKVTINYGDFKRRVLMDAIERVNEIPALGYTLELKEYLSGKKVVKLQFKFIPKKQISLGLPLTWTKDIIDPLKSIGLTEQDISALSEAHSHEVIAESLVRMRDSEQRMREAGRPITSRKAYFQGIVTNVAAGGTDADMDAEKIAQEAQAQEEQVRAEERQKRTRQEFEKHQTEMFARRLFEMPEVARNEILREFEASQEGQKSRLIWEKGWAANKNVAALTLLKQWVTVTKEDLVPQLLIRPEDRNIEAWMAWRLDTLQAVDEKTR